MDLSRRSFIRIQQTDNLELDFVSSSTNNRTIFTLQSISISKTEKNHVHLQSGIALMIKTFVTWISCLTLITSINFRNDFSFKFQGFLFYFNKSHVFKIPQWRRPLKAYVFNFSLAVVLIVFLLVRSCLLMRMTQSLYDCSKKVSFKCVCPFLSLSWPGYVSSSLWTCHYKSKAYVDASLNLIKRCGRHS